MTHTPGPWTAQELDDAFIKGADGSDVARVYKWGGATPTSDLASRGPANARLIASAPTLLEALELAVEYVGRGMAENAYEGTAIPAENALRSIEHAIRVAKGICATCRGEGKIRCGIDCQLPEPHSIIRGFHTCPSCAKEPA